MMFRNLMNLYLNDYQSSEKTGIIVYLHLRHYLSSLMYLLKSVVRKDTGFVGITVGGRSAPSVPQVCLDEPNLC